MPSWAAHHKRLAFLVPMYFPSEVYPRKCFPPPWNEWVKRPGCCVLLQILHWSVSAKLPLVFLMLAPSWRRDASRTVPFLGWRHLGPVLEQEMRKEGGDDFLCKLCTKRFAVCHEQTFFLDSLHKVSTVYTKCAQSMHSIHKICT